MNTRIDTLQKVLKEASQRIAAGRLAEGKLVHETVFGVGLNNFDLDRTKLPEIVKQLPIAFAEKLRTDNRDVFIGVQGHADNAAPSTRNQRLARERGEAVRAFLHDSGGIPLHRMAVVSYGESRPVAGNDTPQERMKNRRMVLEVLR